jgi:hypothetical protein
VVEQCVLYLPVYVFSLEYGTTIEFKCFFGGGYARHCTHHCKHERTTYHNIMRICILC